MEHALQCRCGNLKGRVRRAGIVNHCKCYCKDCQAFAQFLGRTDDVLDTMGGTEIVQTLPANVEFDQGKEMLACIRLSEKGLLRWYAACCNTPIGNTLASPKLSFVGLIHSCLDSNQALLDETFGPITMCGYTESATSATKPKAFGLPSTLFKLAAMMFQARIDGRYRQTPFFAIDSGAPVVTPRVLTLSERQALARVT